MARPPRQVYYDPTRQPQQEAPTDRFQLDLPDQSTSFDPEAFDNLLRSQGATLEHYAAILCPLGLDNKNDIRHSNHPGKCSNGFIYRKIGEVTANVTSNSSNQNWSNRGIEDHASAFTTLPRFYENRCDGRTTNIPIRIQLFDRIYIKDLEVQVVNTEKVEHNQTGIDRLAYPAKMVEFLIDANGKEYICGADFEIVDGDLHWKENRAPGYNPDLDTGVIFSVRYTYTPFYYVESLGHEVRLARIVNPENGAVELKRMPFQLRLQREYAFDAARQKEQDGGDGPQSPPVASARAPRKGSFSPR